MWYPIAPCVSATHESSGTMCSSLAASSERRRMKPTCGPLPCVTTTRSPGSVKRAATCLHVSAAAWYWSGTPWCSLSVMSELPPMAMTAVLLT